MLMANFIWKCLYFTHLYDSFVWHTIPAWRFLSQSFGGLISLTSASRVTVSSNNSFVVNLSFFFFLCLLLRSFLLGSQFYDSVSRCGRFIYPGFIIPCLQGWCFTNSQKFHLFSFCVAVPPFFFLFFPSKTLKRLLLDLLSLPISLALAFIYVLFMLNSR